MIINNSPISTKPLNTKMIYSVGNLNPGMGQAQK